MDKNTININYQVYHNKEEMPADLQKVVEAARKSSLNAYAPYSSFRVGAAVLLSNDIVFCGNNQENASYPEGLCAERVTLFAAMANYPQEGIKAIAICGNPIHFQLPHPLSPCGACRQVMVEYENKFHHPIQVVMCTMSGECIVVESAKDLLPLQFSSNDLNGK